MRQDPKEENGTEDAVLLSAVRIRKAAAARFLQCGDPGAKRDYYRALKLLAPTDFDAYCLFLEKDREPERQFYLPRREKLKPVAEAMNRLAEGRIELLAVSMPPGVGKTTLSVFFLTWLAGKEPSGQILGVSHSGEFLRSIYDECLRILSPEGEYAWSEVFPDLGSPRTNARSLRIDLGKEKRFETLEFTGVEANNAGKVRATELLYCDDLVSGIEQAASAERMDKLWRQYTADLRQRKQGNRVRELHVATRWSVNDVIGRLEEFYRGSDRAEFICLPALNGAGESNFDYPFGLGYSTETLKMQKAVMDDVSWRAIYQGEPIEREGQLYPPDRLRRFAALPPGPPDAVIAACDTKATGSDYCVLPVVYLYGEDAYLADAVCRNDDPQAVESALVEKLLEHDVARARFESNAAGWRIAEAVAAGVRARGGRCAVETRWTSSNKETKIQVEQPWVLAHCLFREEESLLGSRWAEYREMMRQITGYSLSGRNRHDDGPDALAQLAQFVRSLSAPRAAVVKRLF
ncbi:MAG: phage terminase large subunit [Clostridia bacterium]|nr:phage terminase large subunit [Clostridia bacterium]